MESMRLCVLYGSETGTAKDIAERIWIESKKFDFSGPVLSMNDYNVKNLLTDKLIVFVCSTTGQGEEPDNMKKFWRFLLRKDLPSHSLSELSFAVLGLGDSSYLKFNYVAKRLYRRLTQLSAKPILPLGLCDDQHDAGINAVSISWIRDLWTFVREELLLEEKNDKVPQFKFKVEIIPKTCIYINSYEEFTWPIDSTSVTLNVENNIRTTHEEHFQDVRLISFNSSNLDWSPGDVVILRPWNSDIIVSKLFSLFEEHGLSFRMETAVQLTQIYEDMVLPFYYKKPLTLGIIAKYIWDLNAVPRQRVFELLSLQCDNDLEKEKLIEFATSEGLEDFLNYVNKPRRTIIEVLYDFPHAVSKLTLDVLFEMFQIIQPRNFSIASAPQSGLLEILVAVVEYKTILSSVRKGLCSNWLKQLQCGQKILASIKSGSLKIPKRDDIPIIMVGPGTGVAPFRGFLLTKEAKNKYGDLYLFFGCRNKDKDFHCRNDFERLEKKNIVICFYAFSRDQPEKRYVQHIIEENSEVLKQLIVDRMGIVLIAGSSKNMPKDVRQTFEKILGSNYVELMVKNQRYQEETWA